MLPGEAAELAYLEERALHGGNKSKVPYRKLRLWLEDPHCRKCGRLTVLIQPIKWRPPDVRGGKWYAVPGGAFTDDTATIQHVYSKLHPLRGRERTEKLLWCYRCNNDENREYQASVPIEELQRRSRIA